MKISGFAIKNAELKTADYIVGDKYFKCSECGLKHSRQFSHVIKKEILGDIRKLNIFFIDSKSFSDSNNIYKKLNKL